MIFLGVDAGGTKTSFLLADEKGTVLARHAEGSGGFLSVGLDKLENMLRRGIGAVCASAGIDRGRIDAAGLGFPGYGETAQSAAQITDLCESLIGRGRVACECDCHLGWAGSLAMRPGVNIVSGTGSVAYGVNERGEAARAGGWGAYCDEGSCRWLGARLIQTFTKQADGRMVRSPLYQIFRERMGIENDLHFIGPINHQYGGDGAATARLQILLKEIYDAGDPFAAALYREAASELALAACSAAQKLGMEGTFPVSYSGGLFRSGECVLAPLREYLAQQGGELTKPLFTPEEGAVLMAMRHADKEMSFEGLAFAE